MTSLPALPAFTPARFASIDAARDRVFVCDALDLLRALPDASVDAFIFDPPYNIGLDKWDAFDEIEAFVSEAKRVLKPDAFFAFTITAPHDLRWRLALEENKFKFIDHISWVKRNLGAYAAGLNRTHESIYIYRKGRPRYYQTRGKYSDVKVPGLLFDTMSAEGLQRYIDELWSVMNGREKAKIAASHRHHLAHFRRAVETTRAPEITNFTTVWSFLPQNQSTRGDVPGHASAKPLLLFERLVGLLAAPGALIVDPFVGSGTTALTARNLGRHFIACDTTANFVSLTHARLAAPYTLPMFADAPAEEAI